VVGYNVYYGGASGSYTNEINAGNVTTITISGLVAGATYYFAATAYDALGNESDFSSEISYLVPANLPAMQNRSGLTGQFILTVSGSPGQIYDVQASLDFTDTNAANFPQRFYRTWESRP
jgi:hypothetical protein